MTEEKWEAMAGDGPDPGQAGLQQWLRERREAISERLPTAEDKEMARRQLSVPEAELALALWQALHLALEQGLDLFTDEEAALSLLADEAVSPEQTSPPLTLELMRHFIAPEGGARLTPAAFGARLRRKPPEHLELPDGVTLSGSSLTGFLESAHFPYGRYRVGEQQYFVTPSLRLGAATLETLVRAGPGQQRVGREMLLWRPVSFRVAAGTASEIRDARPFVGPSGARAYIWLGSALPGGPLVIRDANNTEDRVPVPAEIFGPETKAASPDETSHDIRKQAEAVVAGSPPSDHSEASGTTRSRSHPVTSSPHHPISRPHPALIRAEEALRQGGDPASVERCLRELMASPGVGGEALARAGQLWQMLGRQEVASAAFLMALERGSVQGALGLSHLAESSGMGIEAAARPLDDAIARNLRSPELHTRYAELLARVGHRRLAEWHSRQANELISSGEWSVVSGEKPPAHLSHHSPLTTGAMRHE